MPPSLDNLKHIVVLMMENRSFDHMLGSLKAVDPRIDGVTDQLSNPDTTGASVKPQALAEFQGQLDPDPDHHFPAVDLQIFGGDTSPTRAANMQGFVKSYFNQQRDVGHSQKIMYYFAQNQLPVLTTLALEFAVFNRWFASIPGPTICNRAFAHYGTSFGRVDMNLLYVNEPFKSIYDRLNQPELFGSYQQFLKDCSSGNLPDYSFVEPNYNDHDSDEGEEVASDQHPDHNIQAGELFIASVYNAVKSSPLWPNTALLVVYDEHGGIYDHVVPPACAADKFTASANDTGTGMPFAFDRLGVRVPAILISPWIPKGTVVDGRVFDHASIPATITKWFLGDYSPRSPRETSADVFIEPNVAPVESAAQSSEASPTRRQAAKWLHIEIRAVGPHGCQRKQIPRPIKAGDYSRYNDKENTALSYVEKLPAPRRRSRITTSPRSRSTFLMPRSSISTCLPASPTSPTASRIRWGWNWKSWRKTFRNFAIG